MKAEESELMMDADDVRLEKIREICDDCNQKSVTHAIIVDFRSAGLEIPIGRYCLQCANNIKYRIQQGLRGKP